MASESNGAVLVVGATRGLGRSIASKYATGKSRVYGTARSASPPEDIKGVEFIGGIDVAEESAGSKIVQALRGSKLLTVVISAGYFPKESFDEPAFDREVTTYKTSAIGPVFIAQKLVKSGLVGRGGKIVLISSEAGSITLRHESEGGGNYAHHASKSALNMVGRLLSLDLKEQGIAVCMLHPGFMRTEMTKSVGFDKFWDDGGAVTPDEAAASIVSFVSSFDIAQTGTFWAPRGPGDIGTAGSVLGDNLPTPLQLPW